VVLNYDISGPASQLGSTGISIYVTDYGSNGTNTEGSGTTNDISIAVVEGGNAQSGVLDLDDGIDSVGKNTSVTSVDNWSGLTRAGTTFVDIAFKIDQTQFDLTGGGT
jgi:hypothetical protein